MQDLPQILGVFRDRRVLVTGHTGFKGSWLSLWLKELGARVAGVALEPHTTPSLFTEARLAREVEDHRGDIRDHAALAVLIARLQPEIVFHLAAQPIVRRSYAEARDTYLTNTLGSVHVFEAVRHTPTVRVLVHVGSDKCYRNQERPEGYREDDALGGHDPYSASKAAAEIAFLSYWESFYLPEGRVRAASGRAGNVVGGGDWAEDRIIPDCARALSQGRPISVRNPQATRPWQHVLEALSGYLVLAASLWRGARDIPGSWNFGPPDTNVKSVREVVERALVAWGSGEWLQESAPDQLHEAKMLSLCCEKANRRLDWHPRWNFEQTVDRAMKWYQGFYRGDDAARLCRTDIQEYMRS